MSERHLIIFVRFQKTSLPYSYSSKPHQLYISVVFPAMLVAFGDYSSWLMFKVQNLLLVIYICVSTQKKAGKVGNLKLWPVSQLLQMQNPILDRALSLTALLSASTWPSNTIVRPGHVTTALSLHYSSWKIWTRWHDECCPQKIVLEFLNCGLQIKFLIYAVI